MATEEEFPLFFIQITHQTEDLSDKLIQRHRRYHQVVL